MTVYTWNMQKETDKKLAWRAEGIFNFLNIKTGVYLLNENKLKRIKEYSDKDI